jgi:hypothetical protein
MPKKTPDLTGQVFGLWNVIARRGSKPYGGSAWLCRCACGTERIVSGASLTHKTDRSHSCGCAGTKRLIERSIRHGLHRHPLYRAWGRMKERCEYTKHMYYDRYGGRGIKICERWQQFETFYDDNIGSWKSGLSLERKDNDGPYSPDNCAWIPRSKQGRNKGNSVRLTYAGKTKLLMDWAKDIRIPARTLYLRRYAGWSDEQILTTPHGQRPKR